MYGKGGEVGAERPLHPARLLLHVRRAVEAASRREFLAAGAAVAVPCRGAAPRQPQDAAPRAGLLAGKNAVIYGAAGAIGGAVSRAFAREGAQVFLAGRTLESVEALAQEHRQPAAAAPCAAQSMRWTVLRSKSTWPRWCARHGRVDISFNLIGLGGAQGTPLTRDDTRRPSPSPSTTPCALTSSPPPRPRATWSRAARGVILALTAQVARKPYVGSGGFGVACAAIEGLWRQLAIELGPGGIRLVTLRSSRIARCARRARRHRRTRARAPA